MKKIDTAEKYRLLGIATDDQRKYVHTIITNTNAGRWTTYEELACPDRILAQIVASKRLNITHQRVKLSDRWISTFAITQ